MTLNKKSKLQNILEINTHTIRSNKNLVASRPQSKSTSDNNIGGALKILLSGRLRGVSMARKFKGLPVTSHNLNLAVPADPKKTKFKRKEKLAWLEGYKGENCKWKEKKLDLITKKSFINKPLFFSSSSTKLLELAVKPQTINSKDFYRLQYKQKDIFTKWGIFGLKIWLYTRS